GKDRWRMKEEEAALAALRQAVELMRQVCERAPSVYAYRHKLADNLLRLGRFWADVKRPADARACFLEARRLCPDDLPLAPRVERELGALAREGDGSEG